MLAYVLFLLNGKRPFVKGAMPSKPRTLLKNSLGQGAMNRRQQLNRGMHRRDRQKAKEQH